MTNVADVVEVNGNGDLELAICSLQEKLLALVEQEDSLREEKNRIAGDFRTQIAGVRKERAKMTKQLKDLYSAEVETEGTFLLESATVPTAVTATA